MNARFGAWLAQSLGTLGLGWLVLYLYVMVPSGLEKPVASAFFALMYAGLSVPGVLAGIGVSVFSLRPTFLCCSLALLAVNVLTGLWFAESMMGEHTAPAATIRLNTTLTMFYAGLVFCACMLVSRQIGKRNSSMSNQSG